MKTILFALFLFPFISTTVFAASGTKKTYISGFYGVATSVSNVSDFDNTKGKVMGASLGFYLGRHVALELSGRKSTFDEKTASTDLSSIGLGTINTSTKLDALVLSAGFRMFFLKIFNVSFGLGHSTVNPAFTTDSTNELVAAAFDSTAFKKVSGLGYYYGGGLQIPLGSIDLYGDYIINQFSSDVKSNEITGGLRLKF
jgi:hypothetical protein